MTSRRLGLCFLIALLHSTPVCAQSDSSQSETRKATGRWEFDPRLHGVQAQGALLILIGSFGGVVDIDLYRGRSDDHPTAGFQFSVHRIVGGNFGGGTYGPYLQSALAVRASFVLGGWSAADFYGGLAYRASQASGVESPGIGPLFGMDIRFGPNQAAQFGLLLKISAGGKMQHMPVFGGIGIFAGWFR